MPTKAEEFEHELISLISHYEGDIDVSNSHVSQPAGIRFPDGSEFLITDSVMEDYFADQS